MSDDQSLEIHTPGDGPQAGMDGAAGEANTESPELVALRAENAQLKALVSDLQARLDAVATVPAAPARVDTGPRLIGKDWSRMTAAEAKAAGCTQRVLCADGYFIPE